jgi:iron-regulated transporter 1
MFCSEDRWTLTHSSFFRYILTIILSRPSQFRWCALVSFASVVVGAFTYSIYVRRERGHLLHWECVEALLGYRKQY